MNIIKKFRASLIFREAVRQADEAHEKTGSRYYVMPNGNSGKLIIMDRSNFRKLKQKGYLEKKFFVGDLVRECFYCTPYGSGMNKLSSEVIALKHKQYFEWLNAIDKTKRNGK